jgi:hypothetical protein
MTPKEKAKELVDNFRLNVVDYDGNGLNLFKAKQCALIAVDYMYVVFISACVAMGISEEDALKKESKHLNEIKQEIEKL